MNIPRASEISGYGVISTGLPQLDRSLGIGGIPFKRITEISGAWSVGKTSLALSLVRSAQQQGIECIWVDAEWAWDDFYARELGVDTDKLGLIQERAAEDALDKLLDYCEGDKVKHRAPGTNTLFIIDAVGALHPREEAEKESGDRTIGSQSSLVARFCRKIVPMLALNNNALVVLNHEYTPIMNNGGRPQLKTSGGAKLEYHKSVWIRLYKSGNNLKVGDTFLGFKVTAEIRKNKLAATQKQECELDMFYGKGFSAVSDILQDALDKGVITRTGNTFWLGGDKLGTIGKVRELFKDEAFIDRVKSLL